MVSMLSHGSNKRRPGMTMEGLARIWRRERKYLLDEGGWAEGGLRRVEKQGRKRRRSKRRRPVFCVCRGKGGGDEWVR